MTLPDDATLHAQIDRHARRRLLGAWIAFGGAALLAIPLPFSTSMMHGDGDFTAVDATIVAVERDAASGELRMTSEFTDAAGVVHRETETEAYHYAPGPPVVGQPIEYLTIVRQPSGSFDAFPRADRILHWMFGGSAAFLAAVGVLFAAIVQRQRRLRRRLVREGRREPGQAPSIRRRQLVVPAGNRAQVVSTWRPQASWFDPERAQFVECVGDWQQATDPEPDLDAWAPVILLDPRRPSRYWLPTPSTPG